MRRLIIIFSHKLTDIQEEDAYKSLMVQDFIYLPENLQRQWSNIDPEKHNVDEEVNAVLEWVDKTTSKDDIILLQGEPGATFKLVNQLKNRVFFVVYSTTKREAAEFKNDDGTISIVHNIKHMRYREY